MVSGGQCPSRVGRKAEGSQSRAEPSIVVQVLRRQSAKLFAVKESIDELPGNYPGRAAATCTVTLQHYNGDSLASVPSLKDEWVRHRLLRPLMVRPFLVG